MVNNNGCSYGKVTRNMMDNLILEFKDFRDEFRSEFTSLKKTNQELYNHLSDRLPKWAIVVGGFGSTLLGIIIGVIVSNLIG